MKPLVRLKRIVSRYRLVVEFCHECGATQPLVWTAPDTLWLAVTGREGGVLCPECFDRLASRQGRLLRWVPRVEGEPR